MTDFVSLVIATVIALLFVAYFLYRQFIVRTRQFEFDAPLDGVTGVRFKIHHDDIKEFLVFYENGKVGQVMAEESGDLEDK